MFFSIILSFIFGTTLGWLICHFRSRALIEKAEQKAAFFEEMQRTFGDQLKGISAQALKQNNDLFLQLAQSTLEKFHEKAKGELEKKEQAIGELVRPVKETLEKFDGKLQELEKGRMGAYLSLTEQIKLLSDTHKDLRKETANLSRALRTPQVRGRWGEMQLKRVVELAGMVAHCDFFEQQTVDREEHRYRPDLLIKLPGKKNIVVDAKAPLEAYLDAIECDDELLRRQKLKDHARQIRNHMTELSRKSYWEQFDRSPEFVILFLPGEPFFSAALEHDPTLIESGVDQKVILATPTTLIALLRAVAYGWRQEALSENAQAICNLGRELYKRLADMSSHWSKVGKSLKGAVEAYNKAVGSLESRVLVSARRFQELKTIGVEEELEIVETVEQIPRDLQDQDAQGISKTAL